MNTQAIFDFFRALADDTGTPPLWSDLYLTVLLQEAQEEAARRARLLEDYETPAVCEIEVVADTSVYTVDPRVLLVRRVKLDTIDKPLGKIDRRDLDQHSTGWDGDNASSTAQPCWWLPWAPGHKLRIELPSIDDTLRLHVVRLPLVRPRLAEAAAAVTSISRTGDVATVTLTAAPTVPLVSGDEVTVAGANQDDYNGAHEITVVSPTVFTYDVENTPVTPATGTITAAISAVDPEIAYAYRIKLVDWMMYRALLNRDKEEKYDPKSAADHLALFEAEFGKRSSAIDETWIRRMHGYDEYEGLY